MHGKFETQARGVGANNFAGMRDLLIDLAKQIDILTKTVTDLEHAYLQKPKKEDAANPPR